MGRWWIYIIKIIDVRRSPGFDHEGFMEEILILPSVVPD